MNIVFIFSDYEIDEYFDFHPEKVSSQKADNMQKLTQNNSSKMDGNVGSSQRRNR